MKDFIQKIDVMMTSESRYNVLHHFSSKLFEAFIRAGYRARLLKGADRTLVPWNDPPDLTIGFNGALIDEQLHCLSDEIHVPHVSWLVDPPYRFMNFTFSPSIIIACDDKACCDELHEEHFHRTLFLPHAVEVDLLQKPDEEKIFDVVLFATYIEYESRRNEWKSLYPEEIYRAMNEAVELTLANETTSFLFALRDGLKEYKLTPRLKFRIYDDVEMYIKGRDRVDLLRALPNANVHIFGTSNSSSGWKEAFANQDNVVIHPPVPFEEASRLMAKSKVVLNSSIKNKWGAHERIFSAIATGAIAVTNENTYIKENFKEDEEIILYKRSELDLLEEKVRKVLSNESLRKQMSNSAKEKVKASHTWDCRVQTLMNYLSRRP